MIVTFLDDLYFQSKDERFRLGFPFNISGDIPPQEYYSEKGRLITNIKTVMKRIESTM